MPRKKSGSPKLRPYYVMKRKLTPKKLDVLEKLELDRGSHSYAQALDKQVCIMEAINIMMHGPEAAFLAGSSDDPPCISTVIREVMISINDNTSSRKARNKLKELAKEIVGTAPSKYKDRIIEIPASKKNGYKAQKKKIRYLVQDDEDPTYLFTEFVRRSIIAGISPAYFYDDEGRTKLAKVTSEYQKRIYSQRMDVRLNAVRMLIDPTKLFDKSVMDEFKAAWERYTYTAYSY